MNISGVDVSQVDRGQVVARPGSFQPTRRIDVFFKLLPDATQPIEHNTEVKLFIGATEMVSRLRLIGKKLLQPGEEGWLQLETRDPIVAVRGDRYILRRPSPGETLGGGVVLDAHPKGRHKRFSEEVLSRLQALTEGSPGEVFMQALLAIGVGAYSQVAQASNLEQEAAAKAAQELVGSGQLVSLGGDQPWKKEKTLITSSAFWGQLQHNSLKMLSDYHQANPLRLGIPLEELKSRLVVETRVFNALITSHSEAGQLVQMGAFARLSDHELKFDANQQKKIDSLMARFAAEPLTPPTIKECIAEVGEDLFQALVALERLLPVSSEVVFRPGDYQQAVSDVHQLVAEHGSVTLAQARDYWGTTRRYVQPLLEFMDQQGVTVRVGDARKLRKK
jgi:selenocysteine-specific elongation factor